MWHNSKQRKMAILLSVAIGVLSGIARAEEVLPSRQTKPGSTNKTIRLIVTQYYEKDQSLQLRTADRLPRRLLEAAGYKIAASGEEQSDGSLSIDVQGTPLAGNYMVFGGDNKLYTGAEVRGTLSFEAAKVKVSRKFHFSCSPPFSIKLPLVGPRPVSPRDAPMGKAFALAILPVLSQVLSSVSGVENAELLLPLLNEGDVDIRFAATDRLLSLKSVRAIDALTDLLRNDPVSEIRMRAVDALESIKDPRVVSSLSYALVDSSVEIRIRAVEALGKVKDPDVAIRLFDVLHDSSPEVRKRAIAVLSKIGDKRALMPLDLVARRDEDGEVRAQASRALERIDKANR